MENHHVYTLVNELVDPENHHFFMENRLPTPKNASVKLLIYQREMVKWALINS